MLLSFLPINPFWLPRNLISVVYLPALILSNILEKIGQIQCFLPTPRLSQTTDPSPKLLIFSLQSFCGWRQCGSVGDADSFLSFIALFKWETYKARILNTSPNISWQTLFTLLIDQNAPKKCSHHHSLPLVLSFSFATSCVENFCYHLLLVWAAQTHFWLVAQSN